MTLAVGIFKDVLTLPKALLTLPKALMTLPKALMTLPKALMTRVVPDIRLAGYPAGYPAFFDIRYPAGYPVKLLNKLCEFRMSKLFSEPFH